MGALSYPIPHKKNGAPSGFASPVRPQIDYGRSTRTELPRVSH